MHLHLDASNGIAGDMLLAVLLEVGLDEQALTEQLAKMQVPGWRLTSEAVLRHGIAARHVQVHDESHTPVSTTHSHSHDEAHDHSHDHGHDHPHSHGHAHGYSHSHAPAQAAGHHHHHHHHDHGPHRHLRDLLDALEQGGYSPRVQERATRVFRAIAEAEGAVHGKSPEEVHFHEVSGIDTLIDVVGACIGLELLGVSSVSCDNVTVGSGTIEIAHGTVALPAPATLAILTSAEIPYRQASESGERITPTGAALLAVLVDAFGPAPALCGGAVGYGAGSKDTPGRANVLRAVLAEQAENNENSADFVMEIRAVIDDMTPEQLANAAQTLRNAGALDVWMTPVVMKKGRAGGELTVLSTVDSSTVVIDAVFRETTTFGIRKQRVARETLERDWIEVDVRGQAVRVKRGLRRGECMTCQPEFDDCAAAATVLELPVQTVMAEAMAQLQSC